MKNLTFITLFAGIVLLAGCGNSGEEVKNAENAQAVENPSEKKVDLIIDIKSISGKTLAEVEQVLGKAESTEKVKGYPCERSSCQKAIFKQGTYEVIFKNDKANRITINNAPNLIDNDNAILALGLPSSPPSLKNAVVIRWNNLNGFNEISFFAEYILVQVTQPD